jgi:hypothetical protein
MSQVFVGYMYALGRGSGGGPKDHVGNGNTVHFGGREEEEVQFLA